MKTILLFLFAMLVSVVAGAAVKVTPLNANYSTQEVTFKVEWQNTSIPYNNRVWVWIDFCPITGTTPAAAFSAATVSNPTKTGGNGTITDATARGFFIEYTNATNAGTTVTAKLSNAPAGQFNWCAYGSDYPPNVTLDNGTYTFKGTTNFIVSNPAQTLTAKTIAKAALTVNPSSTFTDATGCPSIGSLYCPYTGSDLYMDASHLCQQRTGGAKNWEAWIKDTRDNELYRIVFMPDNKWWLAQNVKYAGVGSVISGCTKDECGRAYTWAQVYASYAGGSSGSSGNVQGICPPGWLLPVRATYNTLVADMGSLSTRCAALRAHKSTCSPINDTYGWASNYPVCNGLLDVPYSLWYTNAAGREDGFSIDHGFGKGACNYSEMNNAGDSGQLAVVRCFRQL